MADGGTRVKPVEKKKSLPTCLSCLVKPEKTNVLPKTGRKDKRKHLICNRHHGKCGTISFNIVQFGFEVFRQ